MAFHSMPAARAAPGMERSARNDEGARRPPSLRAAQPLYLQWPFALPLPGLLRLQLPS
jgi:hypothetical protein